MEPVKSPCAQHVQGAGAPIHDPGNIRHRIVSAVPNALLVMQITQTPVDFPHAGEARETTTVLEFSPIDAAHTRVRVSMLGYRDGDGFDALYRFFDWGDSCVSHPFHTLVVTLRSTAYRFDLEPDGPELLRLRDAYLEPWTAFGTRAELAAGFASAYRTGTIARALAWYRYVTARDTGAAAEDAQSVPYGLKLFLADGPIGAWDV